MADASQIELIRDAARKFAEDHPPKKGESLKDVSAETLSGMRQLGWFGMLVPEAYSGFGLDFTSAAAMLQELGRGLAAEPLVGIAVLGVRAIVLSDNDDLKAHLLPQCAEGSCLPAVAWQEARGEAFDHLPSTTALRQGKGWILNGQKRFVLGASFATGFVVSARVDGEAALFWVARDARGLKLGLERRVDGSQSGVLTLDGVSVEAEAVVGLPGTGRALLAQVLEEATVMAAAEAHGALDRACDITLEYMRTRVQFGRPIGSFQALQHRAVDLHLLRELTSAAVEAALATLDETGGAVADACSRSLAASRAKARASFAGLKIGKDAIQFHGAIGYTDEYIIGRYVKRLLVLSAMLGNGEWHRRRLARLGVDSLLRHGGDGPGMSPGDEQGPVKDWNALSDEAFRARAMRFFTDNLPPELRFLSRRPRWSEVKDWYMTLSRGGWLAPGLPVEYGGMGLKPAKQLIYHEVAAITGAPRLHDQGIGQVSLTLLACGTEEQRQQYIPKIMAGEHVWSQGYSEPGSGSDLASLRTEARLEGDYFIINGQKIWTSMAHDATHLYTLVRTDKTVKKHAGISFLLVDLRQPGVTVRPIRNLGGEEEFCEVFLDNVKTHRSNLVGPLNGGWTVAKALLGFERYIGGSPLRCLLMLRHADAVAKAAGKLDDPVFAETLTQLKLDVLDLSTLYERVCAALAKGDVPGFEVSLLKLLATETAQTISELMVSAVDESGGFYGEQQIGEETVNVLAQYFNNRPTTIFGGTNQVQRNILATRLLKLPNFEKSA
jgi:alkylation response protein AidB-like acyl-CoA dehydrogenase